MNRSIELWLTIALTISVASILSGAFVTHRLRRGLATQAIDPEVTRARLRQYTWRISLGMGIAAYITFVLPMLCGLLINPNLLAQVLLGAPLLGACAFISYWLGFWISQVTAPRQ